VNSASRADEQKPVVDERNQFGDIACQHRLAKAIFHLANLVFHGWKSYFELI